MAARRALRAVASLCRGRRIPGAERFVRWIHPPGTSRPIADIIELPDGVRMSVSTASYIEWQMYFFGAYEAEIVRLASELVKPNTIGVDVGANVGTHCLPLAASVPTSSVVAFEPHPVLRKKLEKNATLSGLTNLEISSVAVSDTSGPLELHVPEEGAENEGMSSLIPLGGWQSIPVEANTLDEYFASAEQPIGYMKIDVEGWEAAVLRGATEILRTYRPKLVFEYQREYWDLAEASIEEVLGTLRSYGYDRFSHVTDRGLEPLPEPAPALMNVFAEGRD